MAGMMAKLFPEVQTVEHLIKIVNGLTTNEDKDDAAKKVAELVRKHREVIEKKSPDLEPFLLQCCTDISTPMIVGALRAMYDTSLHKNNDSAVDRSVEVLKHYLDEGKLNPEQLKHCLDIFLPLARNSAFHILEKKKEPEIAYDLATKAVSLVINPEDRMVTSLHAPFLALCIKTGNFEAALPYIYCPVAGAVNESLPPQSDPNEGRTTGGSTRKWRCGGGNQYFDSKYMLQYLYYSALILLKKGDFRRALLHLECCLIFPGHCVSAIQIDAFKKFYIVSLMLNGNLVIPSGRSAPLMRAWKSKGVSEPYARLVNAAAVMGNNAKQVENVLEESREVFYEDRNIGLIEMLIQNLKKKAVLKVAKSFSSITLANLAARAFSTTEEVLPLIEELVASHELEATIDPVSGVAVLNIPAPSTSKDDIDRKLKRMEFFQSDVSDLDLAAQLNPVLLVRTMKNTSIAILQDDEGLSMANSPMDA